MRARILMGLFGILGLTVLVVLLLAVLPERAFAPSELEEIPATLDAPEITFIDPVRGNPDARVTIVEYGDYLCPLCQQLAPDLQALVEEVPQKRRFVWKDAPNTDAHPEAMIVALAARCAQDQGAFWPYYDALFAARGTLSSALELEQLAAQLNLDVGAFANCMASEVTRPVVLHTLQEAISLGLTGTPTFYINGTLYTGPLTKSGIEDYIEKL